jgi:hypothetical protein
VTTLPPGLIQQARGMSENGPGGLRAQVRALCAGLGLTASHYPDSSRCWCKGEPDLRIYGRQLVHVELKDEAGTLSPDQRKVRRLILAAGGEYRLWRPSDLLSRDIEHQLRAIACEKYASG